MSKKDSSARMQRIREELWETFQPEFEELTESLEQQLLSLENDKENLELIAALFRTMHTLKGSSGMMGLSKIEELTHQAEDVMDQVRDQKIPLTTELLDLLFDTLDALKSGHELIVQTKTDETMQVPEELLSGLRHFLDPDASSSNNNDQQTTTSALQPDELWHQLTIECIEQLDSSEALCLSLENHPENKEFIDGLFRNIHTIKGSFNLAGLSVGTQLLHASEDLIGLSRDHGAPLEQCTIDALLSVIDQVRTHLQKNSHHRSDLPSDAESSMTKLTELFQKQKTRGQPQEAQPATASSDPDALTITSGDGRIEIDAEYLNIFFDITWNSLNQIKHHLQENKEASSYLPIIEESLDQIKLAAERMQLIDVQAELKKYEQLATDANQSYEDTVKNTNALWHYFWDLEEELTQAIESSSPISRQSAPPVSTEPGSVATDITETQSASDQTKTQATQIDAATFFDGLWPELSGLRKALENLNAPETVSVAKKALATVKNLTDPVQEFSINNSIQIIESALDSSDLNDEIKNHIANQIQEIYTICWDNEDQLQDQTITLCVTASDSPQSTEQASNQAPNQPPVVAKPTYEPPTEAVTSAQITQQHTAADIFLSEEQDPLFALDFLQLAQANMAQFQKSAAEWKTNAQANIETITQILTELADNGKLLGFEAIGQVVNDFLLKMQQTQWTFDPSFCKSFELNIFSILSKIEESVPQKEKARLHSETNISHVFKQWHAESFTQTYTDCLSHFNELDVLIQQWINGSVLDSQVNDAIDLLMTFINSMMITCQHHQLSSIEEMLLHIDDLLARTKYDKSIISTELISCLKQLLQAIGSSINELREQGSFDNTPVEQAYDAFSKLFQHRNNDQAIQTAKALINTASLPECLLTVTNDLVLSKIGISLENNQKVYLLYLDVEHDEELAEKTFSLLSSGLFETIINATDYHDGRSVFHFLISSSSSVSEIRKEISQVDPTNQFLKVDPVSLPGPQQNATMGYDKANDNQGALDLTQLNQSIGSLHSSVCELISVKASLSQTTQSIAEFDLLGLVEKEVKSCDGDWQAAKHKVRSHIQKYDDDLKELIKAQEDVDSILGRLQEGVNDLRQAPIEHLFHAIEEWFNLRHSNQESLIKLTIEPSELHIEREKIQAIHQPLRQLISLLQQHAEPSDSGSIHLNTLSGNQSNQINITLMNTHIDLTKLTSWGKPTEQSVLDWLNTIALSSEEPPNEYSKLLANTVKALTNLELKLIPVTSTESLTGFSIQMPTENMIIDGITVKSGNTFFVIPIQLIQRIVNLDDTSQLTASATNQREMIRVGENVFPLVQLSQHASNQHHDRRIVLIINHDNEKRGVVVDELIGLQQILLTPLTGQMKRSNKYQGCAVLGKNRIGMIIDPASLY